jgi:hypothetical protein
MSKTGAINHVAISVSDYERGQKFYDFLLKDLLGYDVKVTEPQFTLWVSNSTGACTWGKEKKVLYSAAVSRTSYPPILPLTFPNLSFFWSS